jgi:hypothetical protein
MHRVSTIKIYYEKIMDKCLIFLDKIPIPILVNVPNFGTKKCK